MSNPGLLNRRLTLEAPVESADGAGGVTRSYDAVATLWAQVTPVSAARAFEAEQLGARITHRIASGEASPDMLWNLLQQQTAS